MTTGTYSGLAYPGGRPKGLAGIGADLYLSGLGAYGRWLRRPNRFPAYEHRSSRPTPRRSSRA